MKVFGYYVNVVWYGTNSLCHVFYGGIAYLYIECICSVSFSKCVYITMVNNAIYVCDLTKAFIVKV